MVSSGSRIVLVALALAFWPIQGTTHAWVWTALALAAIKNDWQHHHQ